MLVMGDGGTYMWTLRTGPRSWVPDKRSSAVWRRIVWSKMKMRLAPVLCVCQTQNVQV